MSATWQFGLFGCFGDMEECLYNTCCQVCALARTEERLAGDKTANGCAKGCQQTCLMCICPCIVCPWACGVHEKVRKASNIPGGCFTDCCCTIGFCGCCGSIRAGREVKQSLGLYDGPGGKAMA